MSDLENFFAKRDLKKMEEKKKLRENSFGGVPVSENSETTCLAATEDDIIGVIQVTEAERVAVKETDDGWVDFKDPVSAKVNTGGRKVTSVSAKIVKKKVDDREISKETFDGWKKEDETQGHPKPEQADTVKAEEKTAQLHIKESWYVDTDRQEAEPHPIDADTERAPKPPYRLPWVAGDNW